MNPDETEPVLTVPLTVCFSLLHISVWTPRGHTRLCCVVIWSLASVFVILHMNVSLHHFPMIACNVSVLLPEPLKELVWTIQQQQYRTGCRAGNFLQWLPQKSGGRDYDKSLFHARHGLFPNLRFTKSILGIIDAGASLWVKRLRCVLLRVWAASWE